MSMLHEGLKVHFSAKQLENLGAATVAVMGCGGLGSNLAFMLARSGIRHLRLIDHDTVCASNLNRQAFLPEDIGLPKVTALANHLLRLEPGLQLDCIETRITSQNALGLVLGEFAHGVIIAAEAVDLAEVKAMLFEKIRPHTRFYVTACGLAGLGRKELPMTERKIGKNAVMVGDGVSDVEKGEPVYAPRVIEAASLQANAILRHILESDM